ncbi:fumarylacetoacetate hydrolase family protein [Pyruvatibacter sp.]|uniref:fumarylacetoacetate hydrolase family protein n=1 Tax=Pyruvatibacter sp. TaxID=1981328 RepID=UPI0032EE7842
MRTPFILIWSILMVLSHPAAAKVDIAPRDEALTFARVGAPGAYQLMLVSSYVDGKVGGINLSSVFGADDPITLYSAQGYDAIASADGPAMDVPVEDLALPVDLTASHIAVGTNFPAHAEEASVEDGPFLFAKEVEPTAFNAPIPKGDGLLDFEVELCFVALEDFEITSAPAQAGLILCNDVTDRAKLMRNLNASDVTSGDGFTTGKSAPGYLPVGNLFVIPRDLRSFAPDVDLRLYRGGELAQSARQSLAIWDFDEILRQSAARADVTWDYNDRTVGLPIRNGIVPARTGVLGGTPDGTIFRGMDTMAIVRGVADWVLGGWNKPVTHWVIERQIARAYAQGSYLQAGETITITADKLGELVNTVAE